MNNSTELCMLKTLLTNCINNRSKLKEAYEGRNPFGDNRKSRSYLYPIIKTVIYYGSKKVLKKNNLSTEEEQTKCSYGREFRIGFSSSPSLNMNYDSSLTKEIVVRESKDFPVKTIFGKITNHKVEIVTTVYKQMFALTHGTVKAAIPADEAMAFFEMYDTNLKKLAHELDLEKLHDRINTYPKK